MVMEAGLMTGLEIMMEEAVVRGVEGVEDLASEDGVVGGVREVGV